MAVRTEVVKISADDLRLTRGTDVLLAYKADVDLKQVYQQLGRLIAQEEEVIQVISPIMTFPWDGGIAMMKVLERDYGLVTNPPIPPPEYRTVEVGVGKTVNVLWGAFAVPGIEGVIYPGTSMADGRIIFALQAQVKRKYKEEVEKIADRIREVVQKESIYRGQAFKVVFTDAEGRLLKLPEPKFMDLAGVSADELILNEDVYDSVETSIFNLIQYRRFLQEVGTSFRRGVLLAGRPGTGKTMTALVTAQMAVREGVSFLYCEKIQDFPHAIKFLASYNYTPAVVFCEDIDRVVGMDRDDAANVILNTLDGIDSKGQEILSVLTTNNLEEIPETLARPGRLDDIIEMTPPDHTSVGNLLRKYARGMLDQSADLVEVSKALTGKIPAVVEEVVKKSKLAALGRAGSPRFTITDADLMKSVRRMANQVRLLEREKDTVPHDMEILGDTLGKYIRGAMAAALERIDDKAALVEHVRGNGHDAENILSEGR